MTFESDRENCYLQHYGVPGQKWGVTTKEYVPVMFDKRKLKKSEKKLKSDQDYASGYIYGAHAGNKIFKKDYKKAARRLGLMAPKEKKPDVVDKAVKKAADHFGVGAFSDMASNFLKDQAKNTAVGYLKKNKGKTIVVGGKVLGRILGKTVGAVGTGIGNTMEFVGKSAKPAAKGLAKGTWKATKFTAKTVGKSSVKTAKWLHQGGSQKISRGASFIGQHARNATRQTVGFITRNGMKAAKAGNRFLASHQTELAKAGAVGIAALAAYGVGKKIKSNRDRKRAQQQNSITRKR